MSALLTGRLRLTHKTRDVAERGLHLNRQKILRILSAIDISDTLPQTGWLEVLELCPIMVEDEVDVGIDEHDALKSLKDIAEFGGVGLEELPPGWDIIEEVVHLETAPYWSGCGFLRHHLRGGYLDASADLVVCHTGEQFHLCHSSDGGEGLTTESHRMEGKEIVGLADLRRSMTLKSQTGISL